MRLAKSIEIIIITNQTVHRGTFAIWICWIYFVAGLMRICLVRTLIW